MKDVHNDDGGKKRVRDDSDVDPPETKRLRKDSVSNLPELNRVDSCDSVSNWSGSTRIPNDILDILDEPDSAGDCDPGIQDLDSVIKSFEEEILHPSPPQQTPFAPALSSEHGESQTDLWYLLEASDDELGLPPTFSPASGEEVKTKIVTGDSGEAVDFGQVLGFGDEFPSHDSFGFGIGEETGGNNTTEFVTVGGFVDFESADVSEFLYRAESLHAI